MGQSGSSRPESGPEHKGNQRESFGKFIHTPTHGAGPMQQDKDKGREQNKGPQGQPQRTGGRVDDTGDSGSGRSAEMPPARDKQPSGQTQNGNQGGGRDSDRGV
jgi:hypothetical protein